ncbi:MAG: YkgJ family cysteine cluster protein [Candidatus Omnitrophica bacterium]|nr:YkgJ family cysteine cluster protein [Candidatus Omnitrophota bacterium]
MTFEEVVQRLSPQDRKIIADIMLLYEDIDLKTLNFAHQTALRCKAGCGACCENPDIETTVAEVLPLAVHLWMLDQAENKLKAIQSKATGGICIFYHPDPLTVNKGHCSIYAYRPGICRLFGFCARRDKHGQSQLMTCKIIKENHAQACLETQERLRQGLLPALLLNIHASHVFNIDPAWGGKLLPINQAVQRALEKVGLYGFQEKLKQ